MPGQHQLFISGQETVVNLYANARSIGEEREEKERAQISQEGLTKIAFLIS